MKLQFHMIRAQTHKGVTIQRSSTVPQINIIFSAVIVRRFKNMSPQSFMWMVRRVQSFLWPAALQDKPLRFQNDVPEHEQNIMPINFHTHCDTNLWFSSLSAGVMVFFCFRCSITAFCFITTWNTRRREMSEQTTCWRTEKIFTAWGEIVILMNKDHVHITHFNQRLAKMWI